MNKHQCCEKMNKLFETPILMFFICIGGAASIIAGVALKFYLAAMLVFWTEGRIFFF